MPRTAPPALDLPLAPDPGPGPTYERLASRLRDLVLTGHLASGLRLPASRVLARDVGVSRTTVEEAYARLLDEGFITRRQGSGTFVAEIDLDRPTPLPASGAAPQQARPLLSEWAEQWVEPADAPWVLCTSPCRADEEAVPIDTWRRTAARVLRDQGDALLAPPPPAGLPDLRHAIADHLASFRGLRCTAAQVVVTTGTQQALAVLGQVVLNAGDAVWMEEPGYVFARAALASVGAEVVSVPVDREGLDVEAGMHRAPHARLAYVTPSHQFPTGAVMSVDRRLALLRWAEATGAWIVEDDYDSEYRHDGRPLAPLQSIDASGRVLYVGTFNKSLFPGLRVGYAVVPEALVGPLAQAVRLLGGGPPLITQATVAAIVADGTLASHLRRTRRLYRQRRDALVEAVEAAAIPGVDLGPTEAGLHVCLWLPPGLDDAEAAQVVATDGIGATALSTHSAHSATLAPRGGLVVGYGRADPPALRAAIKRLARVCAGQAPA
ncbi:MAG: PLP-dependent aminotransferase family protein [Bacteroidota bacterium]